MDFNNLEAIIGLEIHAQLNTKTKMFSSESAGFSEGQNNQVGPISLGLPGTLPLFNEQAFYMALKAATAFSGSIKNDSVFSRKNYFYPDLPKGYQISQYDKPYCEGGEVQYYLNGKSEFVSLERIHMEEDAGRSIHKGTFTLVNFNRAGVPLLEIVTKPVIKSPQAAAACAKAIRRVLRYIEICDGNLEQGSMRCDCNISVKPKDSQTLGTKVEIKNINSFRFIEKSLQYEINRQIECLKAGETIHQETRLYDSTKNQTLRTRSKEGASDYRYFPDPDLPIVHFDQSNFKQIKLPELPFQKAERFKTEYKLPEASIDILVEDHNLANYFEDITSKTKDPEATSRWIVGEMQAHMKESHLSIDECPVSVQDFADLILAVNKETISNKIAKEVLVDMWKSKKSPRQIIQEKGLMQISGEDVLEKLIDKTLLQYPKQLESYKQGKTKLFGFFIGQIMKETKGQAHPEKLSSLLKKKLDN